MLAAAPDDLTGMAGVLVVDGIGLTVTRCASVIWVNQRTTSDVRATVHSFLSQAEYLGEITLGIALGVLAQATSIRLGMLGSCALIALAGVWVVRARELGDPRLTSRFHQPGRLHDPKNFSSIRSARISVVSTLVTLAGSESGSRHSTFGLSAAPVGGRTSRTTLSARFRNTR